MVSVIIPCFNLERYIYRAIESVINQTYTDWEIVIIDDGSKDDSVNVCKKYVKQYPDKIKILQQENTGVSVARNNAFKHIKGEFVCFLDGDDYLGEKCFEEVMNKFKLEKELDICGYGYQDITEKGKISGEYHKTRIYPDKPLSAANAFLLKCMRRIWICTGSAVYRTSLIKDNNIEYKQGYKYGEDVNFINTCISYSRKVDFVKKIFFNCLSRAGSATRSGINPGYIHASELNRQLYNEILRREDITKEEREIMLLGCNIDYIHVTTAAAKNVVENVGAFQIGKASRKYKEFNIVHEKITFNSIKKNISKAKLLEWMLFSYCKPLFFVSVKLVRKITRE